MPSPDGSFRQSKWFYERARGQYQDARAHVSGTDRRKFDLEYPKAQVFDKTDLAKYLMLWHGAADVVCRGAQKNFAEFARRTGAEWARDEDAFNELFYRHLVAKAIIFRRTERLVSDQTWYEGGYRAQIVAYAIAKLGHDVQQLKRVIDFEAVWRAQDVSDHIEAALTRAAKAAYDALVSTPSGKRNVSEWAKDAACWARVRELQVAWPAAFLAELKPEHEQKDTLRTARKDQKVLSGIEVQTAGCEGRGEVLGQREEVGGRPIPPDPRPRTASFGSRRSFPSRCRARSRAKSQSARCENSTPRAANSAWNWSKRSARRKVSGVVACLAGEVRSEPGVHRPCPAGSGPPRPPPRASSGGTAFPICRKQSPMLPLNSKASGNDWSRAASRTEIIRACSPS